MSSPDELMKRVEHAKRDDFIFGLYYKDEGFFLVTLNDENVLKDIISTEKGYDWKVLDVTILHKLIFDKLLRVKEKVADSENILYTRDVDFAVNLVEVENYQMAFFLNPPRIEQIRDVAKSGDRMPRKTTYFYPKPLCGLLFYKM